MTAPSITLVFVIVWCLIMMIMMSLDGLDTKYAVHCSADNTSLCHVTSMSQSEASIVKSDQSEASIAKSDQSEAKESSLDGMWL